MSLLALILFAPLWQQTPTFKAVEVSGKPSELRLPLSLEVPTEWTEDSEGYFKSADGQTTLLVYRMGPLDADAYNGYATWGREFKEKVGEERRKEIHFGSWKGFYVSYERFGKVHCNLYDERSRETLTAAFNIEDRELLPGDLTKFESVVRSIKTPPTVVDDFETAKLLAIDGNEESNPTRFGVATGLDAKVYRQVQMELPKRFRNRQSEEDQVDVMSIGENAEIYGYAFGLSKEGMANAQTACKRNFDKHKVVSTVDEIRTQVSRVRTEQGWVGYCEIVDRLDDKESVLSFTLWRGTDWLIIQIPGKVPSQKLLKDTELFVARLTKGMETVR